MKALVQTKTCTRICRDLTVTAKNWRQPKCLSMDGQMNCRTEHCSSGKRNALLTLRCNMDQSADNRAAWNVPAGGVGRTHATGFTCIHPEGAEQRAGTETSPAAGLRRRRKCKEVYQAPEETWGAMDPRISRMLLVISRVYTNIETYKTLQICCLLCINLAD